MSSLRQLSEFAKDAFALTMEAHPYIQNKQELTRRYTALMDRMTDMLECAETEKQHNAISHSLAQSMADELFTRPSPSLSKTVTVKDTNEPTLIIHEGTPTLLPSVSVTKLDAPDLRIHDPLPRPFDMSPFASMFNNPYTSEIEPDGNVDDDVNSEDVGIDVDDKDSEEMEIVEHEGKRYFRGLNSNDVHVIIGDEEAGECVGTFQNGKVVLE
jgi:hypothetical protein